MSLAELGTRFFTEGDTHTIGALDRYEASAGRAEKASDSFAMSAMRAEGAADELGTSTLSLAHHFDALHDSYRNDFAAQWIVGMDRAVGSTNAAGKSARLTSYEMMNLGRQVSDVGVQAAMGTNALMILAMQGPQVADIFATARERGVGFKAALSDIVGMAGRVVVAYGPLIAAGGILVGGFMLWQRHAASLSEALEQTAEVSQHLAEVQETVTDAFGQAASFAEKYKVASSSLTSALDKMILSQNAAYGETMRGIGAMDAAGQAAVRRAEMERLATVAILKRAAAEAEARGAEARAAEQQTRKSAFGQGLIASFGLAGSPQALAMAQQVQANEYTRLGGEVKAKAAKQEMEYAAALKEQADALMAAKLVIPEVTKATEAKAKASRGASDADRAAAKAAREAAKALEAQQAALQANRDMYRALDERLGGPTVAAYRRLREEQTALSQLVAAGELPFEVMIEKSDALVAEFELLKTGVRDVQTNVSGFIELPVGEVLSGWSLEFEEWLTRAERASDVFEAVSYSVDDVFRSLSQGDWGSAVGGLIRAIRTVSTAWKEAATAAERHNVIAGVANAAGQMIGGRAGSAISGAASGFMMGNMIVPGIGGIIGGALGGLAGLFGGGSEKKRQREEEERRKAEEAARLAAEIASVERAQEIRRLQLIGDATAATNLEREAEYERLRKLKPELEATARELDAMADAKAAAETLKALRAAFDDRFISDAEKAAKIAAEVSAELDKLGVSGITTKAAFRALVESTDQTSPLYKALLELSGKFADVAEATEEAAAAAAAFEAEQAAMAAKVRQTWEADLAAIFGGPKETWQDLARANRAQGLAAERAADAKAKEAAEVAAEAFATMRAEIQAAEPGLLLAGRVAEAMAARMSITNIERDRFIDQDGTYNNARFNFAYAEEQAKMAKDMSDLVSAGALLMQNAGGVLTDFRRFVGDGAYQILGGQMKQNLLAEVARAVGDGYNFAIRDAFDGLAEVLANEGLRQRYQAAGPGLAAVRMARENMDFASFSGLYGIGKDVDAFNFTLSRLRGELREGKITFGDYTRAVEAAETMMGKQAMAAATDAEANLARRAAAEAAYQQAGLDAVKFYFGSIQSQAAALAAEASEAATPLALTAEAIGRLTNMASVFNEVIAAATFGGANLNDVDVEKARLIAEMAQKAADAMITADAAAAAEALKGKSAFAGLTDPALRDLAMLVDGLGQNDASAFEKVFLRLNDALVTGKATADQYRDLFDYSLGVYTGAAEKLKQQQEEAARLAAEAEERSMGVLGQRRGLMLDLLGALGAVADADRLRQEASLDGIHLTNEALARELWAAQATTKAHEEAITAAQASLKAFQDMRSGALALSRDLAMGANSPYGGGQRFGMAQNVYEALLDRVMANDATAWSDFSAAAKAMLDASEVLSPADRGRLAAQTISDIDLIGRQTNVEDQQARIEDLNRQMVEQQAETAERIAELKAEIAESNKKLLDYARKDEAVQQQILNAVSD